MVCQDDYWKISPIFLASLVLTLSYVILARGQDFGLELFRAFFLFFSCSVFLFIFISCFFLFFFMFLFAVSGKCFFVLPLFSSSCHALSDVLPHFPNPGFPILRLVSAKHACKSTGHSISGPLVQTGPLRGKRTGKRRKRTWPNAEGKATTKKSRKKTGKRNKKKTGKKQDLFRAAPNNHWNL